MPEIMCHMGHTQHVSTTDWVATLTLDQLRFARDSMDVKIKAAEAQPKRIVWRVCRGGLCEANYQEDQYEKAPITCYASSKAGSWWRPSAT